MPAIFAVKGNVKNSKGTIYQHSGLLSPLFPNGTSSALPFPPTLFSLQSSLCHLCVRAVILIFPGLVYMYEQYLHELLYRTLWHLNVFMHTSQCVSRWSQNIPLLPIYPSFHCCIIDEEAMHSSFAQECCIIVVAVATCQLAVVLLPVCGGVFYARIIQTIFCCLMDWVIVLNGWNWATDAGVWD